ncbi:hypothetical protein GCM10023314_14670 [Algibacter agarivorans]|uniref:Uncharacterized protein n=1 Tax=Algibacter agarivorans TaxID=1109741 RepID=A0ABP9GGD1_9FLAO
MNKESSFIETKSYYELTHTESIPSKALYEKFLNWVSGEFELYLQERLNGLQIFYPGGFFYITETERSRDVIYFKIIVKNKYKQKGVQINNQIFGILDHVIKLKRPSMS